MKLLSLGIAGFLPPAPAPEPEAMSEFGMTGTPIFGGGFLRDLGEYSSTFQGGPFSSFRTYEEMRRGDAQVAATLLAIKLPVMGAEWAVREPKDATPVEKEASKFVKENLFERLDWNAVLSNALLMLDFGCAAHEDVWAIDRGQMVLSKCAPRLPMTFYNWVMAGPESDELVALRQAGYKGGSSCSAMCRQRSWRCSPTGRRAGTTPASRCCDRCISTGTSRATSTRWTRSRASGMGWACRGSRWVRT